MVSKDRKKRQKKKLWDASNEEKRKRDVHSYYMENKQAVAAQAQKRMLTDKTLRTKHTVRVKARLLNDNKYRNINKLRAAMNEKKRRTHPESRERELAKMRNRMKAKLSDNTQYRQEHSPNETAEKVKPAK